MTLVGDSATAGRARPHPRSRARRGPEGRAIDMERGDRGTSPPYPPRGAKASGTPASTRSGHAGRAPGCYPGAAMPQDRLRALLERFRQGDLETEQLLSTLTTGDLAVEGLRPAAGEQFVP